jgi:hypothetical protein
MWWKRRPNHYKNDRKATGLSRETTLGRARDFYRPEAEAFYVGLLRFQVMQPMAQAHYIQSAGGFTTTSA